MTGRILRFRPGPPPAGRASEPPLSDARSAAAGSIAPPADPERFRRLVLPHLDGAYNFARFLCRDSATAEDVVQEAFLRAYRGFGGFRGGDARAWLYAIVRNCVFSSPRSPPADDIAEQQLADEADTPEDALVRASEIRAVRVAIGALPEPFREAIVLRELEELSYREIAAVTGAPIGTVMSRLARARHMLAVALGADGAEHQETRP
jgi:RNA polymerase sigma-70 factor (ECF subfamily)